MTRRWSFTETGESPACRSSIILAPVLLLGCAPLKRSERLPVGKERGRGDAQQEAPILNEPLRSLGLPVCEVSDDLPSSNR